MIRAGQRLSEERIRQKLTLAQVSKATKIREEFLSAIEKGDYNKLPSSAYAHGFVRNYASFLGLPETETLAIFRREFDEEKAYDVLPKGLTPASEFSLNRVRVGRGQILITLVFVLILGFLLFQYRSAFLSPSLKVDTPKENQTVSNLSVTVTGKTDPNATLFIENDAVSIERDGKFKKQITVFPGKTSINIRVVNRFGKETNLIRHLEVRPGS